MAPSAKLNALIAGSTVFIMFWAVAVVAPFLKDLSVAWTILGSGVSLILSAGIYRMLSLAIRWLAEKSECVNAVVLGPHYVNGTWVGWFRGHGGEIRYMVEHFSQDVEGLAISGRSFAQGGRDHGSWFSHSVSVDVQSSRLIFTYTFEGNDREGPLLGIHSSLLEKPGRAKAPTRYSGLAHDLNDKIRIAVHSMKVADTFVPWHEALAQARSEYGAIAALANSRDSAESSEVRLSMRNRRSSLRSWQFLTRPLRERSIWLLCSRMCERRE
jgi:hypothetical protein